MGGKSSKKQKVPYYYMSLQYGICHGPVDSLNQIFVKEEVILCGKVEESTVLYFNKPELFGGETKEGGIAGVIEYFNGSSDQKMTSSAAARFSRTPDTMVGYRGVSYLFCRGYEDGELSSKPPASKDKGLVGGFFSKTKGAWDAAAIAVGTAIDKGFWWQTNNPYLPAAWVHVTRLPKPFGEAYTKVRAPLGDDSDFRTGTYNINYGAGTVNSEVDVSDLFEAIDAGLVVVRMDISFFSNYSEFGWTGPAPILAIIQGNMLDENGDYISEDYPGEGDWLESTGGTVMGGGTLQLVRTLKPGTRTLQLRGLIAASYPLASSSGVTVNSWRLTYTTLGPLLCEGTPAIGSPFDANPAYIIAECLTNRQWGMGHPLSALDTASFTNAAATLYSEFFGLSMIWQEQTTVEKFIMEVLDHIQAVAFTDPSTGLWTIKLIRGDYDVGTLRTLDGTNSVATDRQRKAEGEIINEIVISYKDFQTEEEKTITFHDLAGIAALGQIVSDTRNYYGIRSEALANIVGGRDIRSASYPLFSCSIEADRSFRDVRPGSVLKLDVPEDGISGMVVRLLKVDYGQPGDSKIRFEVIEDIFGLPVTEYTATQKTMWEPDDKVPEPLAQQRAIEPPLPLLLRSGISETDISDDDYPEVFTAFFGDDIDQDVQTISIWGDDVSPSGVTTQKIIGTIDRTTYGTTNVALAAEAVSTLPGIRVRVAAGGEVPTSGDFLYLDGDNADGEFVMLDVYTELTDEWTIARGIFDTIPHAWPSGTVMWYIGTSVSGFDPSANAAGVPTTFKLLPRTSYGVLSEEEATAINYIPSDRPYLPFRPAKTTFDGLTFGGESHHASNDVGGIPATIAATWANRNRLQEDGVAARWDDASVTPEVGQTTTLRVRERYSQVVAYEFLGLTGSSYAVPTASLTDYRFYDVEFLSDRDGFESLQNMTYGLDLERLGYGSNYGYDYGENDGS